MLANEEEFAGSDRSVATLRAKIKLPNKDALKRLSECNNAYSEAIVMVECFNYEISGEQWSEQRRYVAELKEEWKKEQERFNLHRA